MVRNFFRNFTEALVIPTRASESPQSSARITGKTKMAAPSTYKVFSLYLYDVVRFNVDLKCSYTLDYIAALILSPIDASQVFLCVQCTFVLFVFKLVF